MALLHHVELNGALVSFVDVELILPDDLRWNLTLDPMAFILCAFLCMALRLSHLEIIVF